MRLHDVLCALCAVDGVWCVASGVRRLCFLLQGQTPILSRYKAPDQHATWEPDSVLSVKTQPWDQNYADKNIADNPVHATVADLLIGPTRFVFAKLSNLPPCMLDFFRFPTFLG